MDLSAAFLASAACLLLLAALALVRSLMHAFGAVPLEVAPAAEQEKRLELLEEKHGVLRQIKDLESERAVGKLSQEDFDEMNQELRARARGLLSQLEEDLRPYRARAEVLVKGARSDSVVKAERERSPSSMPPGTSMPPTTKTGASNR